jgi:hypothetical protein
MPTPLDKIKEGILNNDISLINEGYSEMTGENLLETKSQRKPRKPKPPKTVLIREDDTNKPTKKSPKLIPTPSAEDFRMPQVSYEEMMASGEVEFMPAKLEDVRISKKANKFKDNSADFADEKKISKAPRGAVSSKRPPVKNIKVKCGSCGSICVVLETEYNPETTFVCRGCLKNKYYGRG